ncbi:MAG: glutaminyl-peptide cyclotransferase [Candidatus Limnocylindrales bacterium]
MRLNAAALAALLAVAATVAASPPMPVPFLEWEVVSRRPHDPGAFTQGLLVAEDGRLYESTGLYGSSSLREVDPASGDVLRLRPLPDDEFGEGLAAIGDELVQLTWMRGLARRFDARTFEVVGRHRYEGQGWGLCYDGQRLIMSDGSDELEFRDPHTFEVLGSVSVTVGGQSLARLNELECVDGEVWANIWKRDLIVRIDPADGHVTGVLDLAGIIEPHPALADPGDVLNGIAYDTATETFLVTGKRWPELIEIRVLDDEVPTVEAGTG